MSQIAVLTDSVACVPDELLERYPIHVIPLHVNFGAESYLDGVEMSLDEFYRRLRENKSLPTTSAPSVGEFKEFYQRLAEGGAESIVCIPYGGELGMGYSAALTAAKELSELDIRVINSHTALMAQGFLAVEAARAVEAGATVQEVIERVQAMISQVDVCFMVNTLEYLRRGGRISHLQAFMGSMLDLKPLLHIPTDKGTIQPLGRCRTRVRAIKELVNHVEEMVGNRPLHITVHQSDAEPEEMKWLLRTIEERFELRELYQSGITPVVGTHFGPKGLALAFWAESA